MKKNTPAFTLIELVIVMAVIAAVAGLTLGGFADNLAQDRQRETAARGAMVREALTGGRDPDGVSRFLNDMGRWPRVPAAAFATDGAGRELGELYDPAVFAWDNGECRMLMQYCGAGGRSLVKPELKNFGLEPAPGNGLPDAVDMGQTMLRVGWNGPYINVPAAENPKFYDGWGNPWHAYDAAGAEIGGGNARAPIYGIASFGANNLDDESNGDTEYADCDQEFSLAPGENTLASLQVELRLRAREEPKGWKNFTALEDVKFAEIPAYTPGRQYDAGDVVKVAEGAVTHYYQSAVKNNALAPFAGTEPDYQNPTPGWRYAGRENGGVYEEWSLVNGVTVLLYAPAEIERGKLMDIGFFRFSKCGAQTDAPRRFRNDGSVLDDGGDPTPEVEFTGFSAARLSCLAPGRRPVCAAVYLETAGRYPVLFTAPLETAVLRPGGSHLVLYLERQK